MAWKGLKGEAPAFHNRDQFLEYFQDNWIEGNYPLCMWNMYSLDGPHTNNNVEGWHSKIHKLAGKVEQTFALFVRRNGIRQNGIRRNGMIPTISTQGCDKLITHCNTVI